MTLLATSYPLSDLPSSAMNEDVADFDEEENDDFSMPDCIEDDFPMPLRQDTEDCDDESLGGEALAHSDHGRDASCTLQSSMSLFISGLVGGHAEQQLVVTMDNARPRDLPQPCQDSGANVKKNAISRWESSPSNHNKNTRLSPRRPCSRAVRPLPGANPQNHPMKQIGKKAKDAPIVRPQRMDSSSSLNGELSISDLREMTPQTSSDGLSHHSVRNEKSMNLDALIAAADKSESSGVYVKIPALTSENSLWGSASTMTMTSSFMSQSALFKPSEEAHRSLFAKSETERPMRLPRRIHSGEQQISPPDCVPSVVSDSPKSEKPLKRPVRKTSDSNVLQNTGIVTPPPPAEETPDKAIPELLHYSTLTTLKEESSACSIRSRASSACSVKLSRSSSDQSLMRMPEQSLTFIIGSGNKLGKKYSHEGEVRRFAFKRAESEPIMSPEDDLHYMADNNANKRFRRM